MNFYLLWFTVYGIIFISSYSLEEKGSVCDGGKQYDSHDNITGGRVQTFHKYVLSLHGA